MEKIRIRDKYPRSSTPLFSLQCTEYTVWAKREDFRNQLLQYGAGGGDTYAH